VVRPVPRLFDEFAPGTLQWRFTRLDGARRKFQQRLPHGKPILCDQEQTAVS
jgi:hypothetical protein